MPPSVYICVYLCISVCICVRITKQKNIPSRDRLNPERLTMPQDVAIGLHLKNTKGWHKMYQPFVHQNQEKVDERLS